MNFFSEDIEPWEKFTIPHYIFPQQTISQRKLLAWHIYSLKNEEVLLMHPKAFSYEGVIAGLTLENIEFIAKNGGVEYKKEIGKSFLTDYIIKEAFQIVAMMDEDVDGKSTEHKDRMRNIFQYVSDNWVIFA